MGEASRRKREGREVKDPLRFQRVNIEAYSHREKQFAQAYHQIKQAREEAEAKLEASIAKLTADGHPFYTPAETPVPYAEARERLGLADAPEAATAPEAAASEVQAP